MGHEDVGHFADKHPKETHLDPALAEKIKQHSTEDQLTCAAAHRIAEELSLPPAQIGIAMDLMEIRIGKCQMGLFGYQPQKRIVKPSPSVPAELKADIQNALTDNRISCQRCWALAVKHDIRKIDVAAACESLQIKINRCQLGAF
ncbi:MAG: hypothetical protein P8Y38_05400 [Deltaproteobacteria bacterium]|jgi:hypothetical protein